MCSVISSSFHLRFFTYRLFPPQLLYDYDIVEEKAMLEWAVKPSRKYASKEVCADVRRRAQPFLDWLKEADEEDSDTQDEEDFEVSYSTAVTRKSVASEWSSGWCRAVLILTHSPRRVA